MTKARRNIGGPSSFVDLLGRYSNTRQLRRALTLALVERDDSVDGRPAPRIHKLEYRLGPSTIGQIVKDYRSGFTSTQLMDDYGISKTSILRVLHEAGAITPGKRNQRKRI